MCSFFVFFSGVPHATFWVPPIAIMLMNLRRCVVLAVDDETIILLGTAALLESLGYKVVRANSGRAALEALADRPEIGALLTDLQMPSMSGAELATTAQNLRPDLPVIIATGHSILPESQGRPWVSLPKPFTRADLARAMEIALSGDQ